MTDMNILGQMMMQYPKFNTVDWGKAQLDAQRIQRGRLDNQTALLALEDLKRQQDAQAQARAYYQQHPGALLGNQGQPLPTLATIQTAPGGPPGGPMTQQTVTGGQPPGMPQQVPGGQDLSRFAGVSPQGGGPIPPDVMGQVTPTMTPGPPQPGMPTLATLGQPQAPANPLIELMRRNPDAAFAVLQQQQQQQDLALKRDEQRLTMGTKVAEYVGRVAQGITSPETLEQARLDLSRIHPQAAAQLPQTYSKEAMVPFVRRAVSVKDNATLQLETWKNQIEMQKAGLQGEPAAMVSELRTMGVNPLQATTEQRQQAQKNIQQRELAKEGEAQRLKFEQEQQLSSTLPLQDARKEDAGLFVSKGTGQTIPGTTPYGQVKQLQDEKDPEKGVIKLANLDEKKQLTTLKQLEPVLQQYADLVQYAYGPNGPLENYTRSPGSVLGAAAGQATQSDPTFQAKRRALQGQLQSVVRGLGARGDLNESELAAAKEMIANMDASMGLGLNIGFGVGTGGAGPMVGVKPSFSLPDTPETGINLANELIGTVNRRIGSILQHEGYSKTPFITLRTNQQGQPQPGVMPQAMPGSQAPPLTSTVPPRTWGTMQPATPGQPTPPAPGQGTAPPLPPAPAPPQAGPLGAPPQTRYVPPAPTAAPPAPAPATPGPTPPTATSTPAQDEAYRRSLAPPPTPPAARPTPGRQSQAPTGRRLAGAPKYMELADVAEAMRQTGRSRREVEAAARSKGYTVYGSRLKLPEETATV